MMKLGMNVKTQENSRTGAETLESFEAIPKREDNLLPDNPNNCSSTVFSITATCYLRALPSKEVLFGENRLLGVSGQAQGSPCRTVPTMSQTMAALRWFSVWQHCLPGPGIILSQHLLGSLMVLSDAANRVPMHPKF